MTYDDIITDTMSRAVVDGEEDPDMIFKEVDPPTGDLRT
jgi:hypothetical protein